MTLGSEGVHTDEKVPILMITETLLLVEQVSSRGAQVYDFGTPIPIFLEPRAFKAVEGIRYTLTATDNAFILVISKGALITNANKCSRSHIAIADGAFPVTFVAKSSYSNS